MTQNTGHPFLGPGVQKLQTGIPRCVCLPNGVREALEGLATQGCPGDWRRTQVCLCPLHLLGVLDLPNTSWLPDPCSLAVSTCPSPSLEEPPFSSPRGQDLFTHKCLNHKIVL